MTARTISVEIVGMTPPRRRMAWMVRLGCRLHPAVIKDAWYEQKCPKTLDRAGIPFRTIVVWRIACWLRGTRRES